MSYSEGGKILNFSSFFLIRPTKGPVESVSDAAVGQILSSLTNLKWVENKNILVVEIGAL